MKPTIIQAVADTGAQSCLWGQEGFLENLLRFKDLFQVCDAIKVANGDAIRIDGTVVLGMELLQAKNVTSCVPRCGGERILGNDDGNWFELEKVSWEGLVEATNSDNIMLNLKATLTDNKPIIRSKLPEHLHGFCGFIFHAFLCTLHSAHLGTSSMMVPVIATVVWPNLTVDLKKSQELCCSCNSIALSQAGIPPTQYVIRSTTVPGHCS
ncbi:unnamed protein product [Lepeophtheirus salmonis]|uniref:(salmon louse) hypothetical protein n=1 Tax=Lepeophtheirus salmonis TaxID=72036 RepID=A0A7R8CJ75_LEPSM|nr:unnamed protein product [Lepeophtheirus salmonis]CAF2839577.1 unnamed protein product [Lepeophtheirus salmonis]